MNKVVTINLAGRAYELEEGAYDALRQYLDDARKSLADDPDLEEILSDLEAAIGQKCAAYLSAHKTVVTTDDMQAVLEAMGPVDPANESAAKAETRERQTPPYKKLYRVREGEMLGGICNGFAAYFGIDVTLVRILFVLFAVLTGGGFAFAYFAMMFFIPEAETPEERAQAFGAAPLTAQELVDQARKSYERFANSDEWRGLRRQVRQEARDWKHRIKTMHEEHKREQWGRKYRHHDYGHYAHYGNGYYPARYYSPFGEFMQMLFGIFWLLFWGFVVWWLYGHVAPVHQFLDLIGTWLTHVGNAILNWLTVHVQ